MHVVPPLARGLLALATGTLCCTDSVACWQEKIPAPVAAAASSSTLAWRSAAPMKHARSAHALAATDTALFVVGGTGAVDGDGQEPSAAQPVLEVERFDCKNWSVETTLPGEGLNAPAAVIFEQRLWVIGGFGTTSNVPVASVRIYDFETRTWSDGPQLPAARGGHAAIVFGERIHVLGGGNSVSTLADHCAFDPVKRCWEERAPLSRAKGSPAAVAFENKLWIIGGRSGASDFGDVECYDDATNHWTAGPAIEARGTAGAVVWGGTIWIVGGESKALGACLASVLRFDPQRRAWEPSTALPMARNYARSAVLGDTLFVVGGSATAGFSHSSAGSAAVQSARMTKADAADAK